MFTHPGVTERRECWCCGGLTAFQLIHSFRRLGLFSQHSSHSMKHSLKDRAFYGGHRGVIRKSIDSQQGGLNQYLAKVIFSIISHKLKVIKTLNYEFAML